MTGRGHGLLVTDELAYHHSHRRSSRLFSPRHLISNAPYRRLKTSGSRFCSTNRSYENAELSILVVRLQRGVRTVNVLPRVFQSSRLGFTERLDPAALLDSERSVGYHYL